MMTAEWEKAQQSLMAYIMGNNKARVGNPDTDLWYLTTGVLASDVICAYQPKTALSLANSYVNLVTPGTGDAVATTPPTWNSTDGWIFNGSTQYLDTGAITITENLTVMVRYSGFTTDSMRRFSFGCTGAGGTHFWMVQGDDGKGAQLISFRIDGTQNVATPPAPASAVVTLSKTGLYYDSVLTALGIVPVSFSVSNAMGIGNRLDEVGVPAAYSYFTGNIQAFVVYNKTLTDVQENQIRIYMSCL
jgi:hypothetical protein